MTLKQELAELYQPLTIETRIEDFDLPKQVQLGGKLVNVPEVFLSKDVHWLVNWQGKTKKAAWISKVLAHILNSYKQAGQPGVPANEIRRATQALDDSISRLIRNGVLKDKQGPGAMSFSQANENVPVDAVVITERTWEQLCNYNYKWKNAQEVIVIRFPNLGPGTTCKLRLIIDKEWIPTAPITENSIANRAPSLAEFFDLIGEEESVETEQPEIIDAFYLHPSVLQQQLTGDADGDAIYMVIEKLGRPRFQKIDFTRAPGCIREDHMSTLFKKANRVDRSSLSTWLPPYIDDIPIGQATYAIRWELYKMLKKYKSKPHPMHEAWAQYSPEAIELIEFVMDIRKNEWTEAQIIQKLKYISSKNKEIAKAREEGNWFAKTVTNNRIEDVRSFVTRFRSLQDYANYITGQQPEVLSA